MIRFRPPSKLTVNVAWEVHDGETTHASGTVYRCQYGFQCDVTAIVYAGSPRTHEEPGEGPTVEIVKVVVTDIVVYGPPDFSQGVSLDTRDKHLAGVLASYAAWCKDRLEGDEKFEDRAIEVASDEVAEMRDCDRD